MFPFGSAAPGLGLGGALTWAFTLAVERSQKKAAATATIRLLREEPLKRQLEMVGLNAVPFEANEAWRKPKSNE